ncbi:hypothetical protein HZS_2630 [Henneguya salminicola]|nr:hypothetical protein HZS_2630 [Henneguya salminicola]
MDLTTKTFIIEKKSQNNGKYYYICRRRYLTRCPTRLIASGDTITMKGFHTCPSEKQILTNQIQ